MKKGFEEQRKKEVFRDICKFEEKNQIILVNAKAIKKKLQIDGDLGNITHTAIEKIIGDIEPQFKNAGLSFYSDSIVAKSISDQLVAYTNKGHKILVGYEDSIKFKNADESSNRALKEVRPLSRFWTNFRRVFMKDKKTITPEALEKAKKYMGEYISLDKELSEYNLRDNVVPAIMHTICPDDNLIYLDNIVPILMQKDIEPTLTRLGLGDLIPRLNQEIQSKYREETQEEEHNNISQTGMPNLEVAKKEEELDGFEPGD